MVFNYDKATGKVGSNKNNKDAMLQLAEEITGADSSLVKYIQDTDVASVSQVGFAQSQKTVIQGTTKFSAVMKTAGGVAKSFVATLGSMAVAAAAAWAIGKAIEGIDYIIHYDENIIRSKTWCSISKRLLWYGKTRW